MLNGAAYQPGVVSLCARFCVSNCRRRHIAVGLRCGHEFLLLHMHPLVLRPVRLEARVRAVVGGVRALSLLALAAPLEVHVAAILDAALSALTARHARARSERGGATPRSESMGRGPSVHVASVRAGEDRGKVAEISAGSTMLPVLALSSLVLLFEPLGGRVARAGSRRNG